MDWTTALDLYLLDHEAQGRSPATIRWHRHILQHFRDFCQALNKDGPGDLSPADLMAWLVWTRKRPSARGETLDPSAVWSLACSVRAFLRYLHEQGYLERDLAAKLKVQKPRTLPQPFSDEELAALWQTASRRRGAQGARDRALLAFLIDTGCRAGEVCGLNLDDLAWDTRLALVTGKGAQQRMVAFGPKTVVVLRRYLPYRDPANPALFQNTRGERWTPNALGRWARRLGEVAGVAEAHPHRFRASFATTMAASGNLFAVQQQLGHSTLEMTRRYAQVSATTLRHAHDQASPFLRLTSK